MYFNNNLCLFTFRQGYQAEPLAKWVEDRTGVHVCLVHDVCDLFRCIVDVTESMIPALH